MKKDKNEELQSRREFFKSAAKAALPVIGAAVLANMPEVLNAQNPRGGYYSSEPNVALTQWGCSDNSCSGGCKGSCQNSCYGTCSGSCKDSCTGNCQGGCTNQCTGCGGGCANTCSGWASYN